MNTFDKIQAEEHIKQWSNNCAVCKRSDGWIVMDRLWQIPEHYLTYPPPLENLNQIPVVAVICANCGQTMLFNAIAVGILPPPEK